MVVKKDELYVLSYLEDTQSDRLKSHHMVTLLVILSWLPHLLFLLNYLYT
jgi:hypothetical protein